MGIPTVSIPGVEILEELGRGSRSVVYRARRQGRYCAVKVPLETSGQNGTNTSSSSSRLLREAVALARLRHPALPAVMEVGRSCSNPYIVMDLVAGETLRERLHRGPLDERRVIELGIQLTEAVEQIHHAGLAHRDINSTNILFDSLTDAVRLIDFGFVANTPSVPPSLGTDIEPREPGLGSQSEVQRDLRAIGAVMFQSVTGARPFSEIDPRPLLERSSIDIHIQPQLSAAFCTILHGLLLSEARPAYPDAWSLLTDLRRILAAPGSNEDDHTGSVVPSPLSRGSLPLLGRQKELMRLRSALRASAAQSQAVIVRGLPGSGKTRLIQTLLATARDSHDCLVAVCEQSRQEPFGTLRLLLEAQLSEYEALPTIQRVRALARLRSLAADVAPLLRLMSARFHRVLKDTTRQIPDRDAIMVSDEAFADFLSKLWNDARTRLIVVDDVQWLDAGSRRVFGHLSDHQEPHVLYLFAARDDSQSWPVVSRFMRALDGSRLWEVSLDALDEENTLELLKAYLGTDQPSEDLLRHVVGVSDGTPLGVIEVAHGMLEGGALIPYWGEWRFDTEIASRLDLPRGSLELLIRRTQQQTTPSLFVLTTAAVAGMHLDETLLAAACACSRAEIATAIAEARHALLVEACATGHRFVHDAVREALLARTGINELRRIHQSIAEALDRNRALLEEATEPESPLLVRIPGETGEAPDLEIDLRREDDGSPANRRIYALAGHYSEGELDKNPKRTLEVCLLAGNLAFRRYDSDLALHFFQVASNAAELSGVRLDTEFQMTLAEAELRMGRLESALKRLDTIVACTPDPTKKAHALSRVAWAEMQIDVHRAWSALFTAFRVLDVRPPSDSVVGVLFGLMAWLGWLVHPRARPAAAHEEQRLQVLCQLRDQTARLAADMGKPRVLLQTVLTNLTHAQRLGPSRALNGAYLLYAFVLTILGFHRAGRRYTGIAEEIARATKDPTIYARSLQVSAAVAVWGGNARDALGIAARSLVEYGHWTELGEYCITAYMQQQIEGVRGRCLDAWRYLEHAVSKLGKHEGPPMALEFIEHSVRATLTALGRARDADPLIRRLSSVTTRPPTRGAVIISSYGSRARLFTECANLGTEFQALIAEVNALELNPKRVHLEVVEYYVHVAHARVHACLRSVGTERQKALVELGGALRDLRLAARIPLIRAHARAVEAYVALFHGDQKRADHLFEEAYALGVRQGMPWVLYAVHRGRAHALRARGLHDAALDQARSAEALAREHGAAYRVRWIREEFSLGSQSTMSTGTDLTPFSPEAGPFVDLNEPPSRSRLRPRSYLKSLVRIGQHTAHEFGLAQQARVVLGELMEVTRAERGFLFLTSERLAHEGDAKEELEVASEIERPALERMPLVPVAVQDSRGRDLPHDSEYAQQVLEDALSSGQRQAEDASLPGLASMVESGRAMISVSLVFRGEPIGAVYLERSLSAGVFGDSDFRSLTALAIQVPLVFELARFLRERERAEETQRSADKLEAIGRLAGGIAHDFNNMLSVILGVTDQILTRRSSRSLDEDIKTAQSAAERAGDLTRQLLAFSRGQYLRPEVLQLNELIERLEPILRKIVGDRIVIQLELDADLCRVKADPAQIDQVLTNLVVNARDAMADGGRLLIETDTFTLAPGRDADDLQLPPGRYARIAVVDTGVGMNAATVAKIFEPFFTTKPTGSGLGLPTAYGIVKQSGGHIDVESRIGKGTAFRILLPETKQRPSVAPPSVPPGERSAAETILLVDDEPLVREATRRTLRSLGYQVVGAKNAEDALRLIAEQGEGIRLVITDVMMPGMNGLELARELGKLRPSLKVLFISGYTAGVLTERGFLSENVDFVQKPVSRDALAQRLRELLDGRRD